jgi:choline dehydrogenase
MAAPTAWPTLIGSPVDWGYSTVTQQGLLGAELPYPRGKVLGGSSGVNAMVHLRAHHASYDAWAAAGATGWGYEDLVPYFRRSETENADRDERYRGSNGPMRVGPPQVAHPYTHAALAAVRECGFPTSSDLNGAEQEGATRPEMNIVDGVRQSAADAYLRPIVSRPNLTVTTTPSSPA